MQILADLALFVLSDRESIRHDAFAIAIGEMLSPRVAATLHDARGTLRRLSADLMTVLESLGHCDRGLHHLYISQPALCLLPKAGYPTAVLSGRRSPATTRDLVAAAKIFANDLRVVQRRPASLMEPSRISLTAPSVELLAAFAAKMGLAFSPVPPSGTLAHVSGSLDEFEASLQWQTLPEPNWEREDFHPEGLRFKRSAVVGNELRLSRYANPVTQQLQYFLCREGERAPTEPVWARLAILRRRQIPVLTYKPRECAVMHDRWLPLPPLLRRSLVLCSGSAPSGSAAIRGDKYCTAEDVFVYSSVPPTLYNLIARKAGHPCHV